MNDFDLYMAGLKKQDETWWGKKILENGQEVASGKYGEVLKEWRDSDGWGDGIQVIYFVVFDGKKASVLKATESGVFEKLDNNCGWRNIQKLGDGWKTWKF